MAKKSTETKPAVERKSDDEKKEALSAVFKMIEREYGKGSIMKLGDTHVASVDAIPTGSMTLDLALASEESYFPLAPVYFVIATP